MGRIRGRPPKLAAIPQRCSSSDASRRRIFPKGAAVEVCSDEDGFRGAWYEAAVIRFVLRRQGYEVAYASLLADEDPSKPLYEVVRRQNVRPRPPPPSPLPLSPGATAPSAKYAPYDLVEAFHNDGWWAGVVSAVLLLPSADPKYIVCFPTSREAIEFEAALMRRQLHWVRHRWVTTQDLNDGDSLFAAGDLVEVSREMEKFGPAWFAATVLEVISTTTFEIEYQYENLRKKENDNKLLTEILDVQYMRPVLPLASETKTFSLDDHVEVFHNGGWSPAVVSKTLGNSMYIVKLKHNNINMKVVCSDMRPLRTWNGLQWVHKDQDETEKSLPFEGRQSKHTRKRYSIVSVPTSSDDGKVMFEPHSNTLSLKCDNPDASNPEDLIKLSKLKKSKLMDVNSVRKNNLALERDSATPSIMIENRAAMYTEEDNTSSMEKQHFSESWSLRRLTATSSLAIEVPADHLFIKIHGLKESSLVNCMPELPPTDQEHLASIVKDPKHNTESNCKSNSTINCKSCNFNSLAKWSDCKGRRSPRTFSARGRKKLAIRPAQRPIIGFENTGERLLSQAKTASGTKDWSLEKRISAMHDCMQRDVDIDSSGGGQQDELSNEGSLTIDVSSMSGANGHPEKFQHGSVTPCSDSLIGSGSPSIDYLTALPLPDMMSCSFKSRIQGVSKFPSSVSADNLMVPALPQENNGALQQKDSFATTVSKVLAVENEMVLVNLSSVVRAVKEPLLPFSKTSSVWKPIESMEVFRLMPQQPHFSPLEQYSMEFREGMAIGLMVSFANLVSSIKSLHISDSQASIEEKLSALASLEAHGFIIEPVCSRLQKLLDMQIYQKYCENIKMTAEANILKMTEDNVRIDASIVSLDKAIKELEEKITRLHEERESIHKQIKGNEFEISKLKMDMQEAEESYHSVEKQFSISSTAPW